MDEQREIAIKIMEEFEGFLSEKDIKIENSERDERFKELLICNKCKSDDCYLVKGRDYKVGSDKCYPLGKTEYEVRCNNCGEHFELDEIPSILYGNEYYLLEDAVTDIIKKSYPKIIDENLVRGIIREYTDILDKKFNYGISEDDKIFSEDLAVKELCTEEIK